jgi:hypothetical protein
MERVDTAYVDEVIRSRSNAHPRKRIVLGLDEPPSLELAG